MTSHRSVRHDAVSLRLTGFALAALATLAFSAPAAAADQPAALDAAAKPAVDGINGKIGFAAGGNKDGQWDGLGGAYGTLTLPLGRSFGLQLDGTAGAWGHETAGQGSAHLFWRNPDRALLGVYASGFRTSVSQIPTLWQGAGEAFLYFDRFTIGGLVGAQRFESNRLTRFARYDKADFFDQLAVSWYPTDTLMLSVGHVRAYKKDAVTAQIEKLLPGLGGKGTAVSVFAQGLIGEGGRGGALVGVTIYFGASDKSLMRRHREDDPPNYTRDNLSSLLTVLEAFSTPRNPQITDSVTQLR